LKKNDYDENKNEVTTYASQGVGNLTNDGRVLSVGVNFWSTRSTGKLASMDDMMNIFRFHADQFGNISTMGWEWRY
jgi:hypothetical protein